MSIGWTEPNEYTPSAQSKPRSRASVAGLHDTYTTRRGWSTRSFLGDSYTIRTEALDLAG
jgi:hypothetical protein